MSPDKTKSRSGRSRGGGQRAEEASAARRSKAAATNAAQEAAADLAATAWSVRPASALAHKQWEAAMKAQPDLMTKVRDRLRTKPLHRGDNPRRTGQLHGGLATRNVGGRSLPQWQHEITGGGRVWYCPDPQTRTVWVTQVSLSHPKDTE